MRYQSQQMVAVSAHTGQNIPSFLSRLNELVDNLSPRSLMKHRLEAVVLEAESREDGTRLTTIVHAGVLQKGQTVIVGFVAGK